MNIMQKRERNKSSSKVEQIFCNICKRNTNHKILYSLKKTSSDDFNDGSFFRCESWHEVLECLGCECISFRQKVSSTDDYDKTGNLNIVSLFPRRDENLLNPKYFFAAYIKELCIFTLLKTLKIYFYAKQNTTFVFYQSLFINGIATYRIKQCCICPIG